MIKKIILFIVIALTSGIIASYFTLQIMQENGKISASNVILYDLLTELDLYELWESKYKIDRTFETNIKHLIYDKIASLSLLDPTLNELDGVSIMALNRLLIISKTKNFAFEQNESADQNKLNYLFSIEKEVQNILEKRKELYQNELEQLQIGIPRN